MLARWDLASRSLVAVLFGWALAGRLPDGIAIAAGNSPLSSMKLTSPAFAEGQSIPSEFTCDGQNVSPPLQWQDAPAGTRSFALITDDPDAPGGLWVHWVLFDVPGTTTKLPEGISKTQYLPGGAKQGLNDFKHLGYGGPCPPAGKPHRYFFKLYALNTLLELKPGISKAELETAMHTHVLAEVTMMGLYKRK